MTTVQKADEVSRGYLLAIDGWYVSPTQDTIITKFASNVAASVSSTDWRQLVTNDEVQRHEISDSERPREFVEHWTCAYNS